MREHRVRDRVRPLAVPGPALLAGLAVAVLGLTGCQTPAEPRPWYDEFTDESGLYIHASRQSGGYDVRFATRESDADHVQMRVRSTRPIHGRRAYFRIDDERHELPIYAKSYQAAHRGAAPRGAVGVTGGGGPGVHTGVGVSLGPGATRLTTFVTVKLPNDLVRQILGSEEASFRIGGPAGPTETFSERTREHLNMLLERAAAPHDEAHLEDDVEATDTPDGPDENGQ